MKSVVFKIPDKNKELLEHIYTYEDIVIVPHDKVADFEEFTKNDIEYAKLYILNKSETTANPNFYYKRNDLKGFVDTGIEFAEIYNLLRSDYIKQKDIEEEQMKINSMLDEVEKIDNKYNPDKKEDEKEFLEEPAGFVSTDCARCVHRDGCPIDYRMGSNECMETYEVL